MGKSLNRSLLGELYEGRGVMAEVVRTGGEARVVAGAHMVIGGRQRVVSVPIFS